MQLDHELDRLINAMLTTETESCAKHYLALELAVLDLKDRLEALEKNVDRANDRLMVIAEGRE